MGGKAPPRVAARVRRAIEQRCKIFRDLWHAESQGILQDVAQLGEEYQAAQSKARRVIRITGRRAWYKTIREAHGGDGIPTELLKACLVEKRAVAYHLETLQADDPSPPPTIPMTDSLGTLLNFAIERGLLLHLGPSHLLSRFPRKVTSLT